MEQENIMFFKDYDQSYTVVDIYLYDRFFGYKDSYNYYDIDVDKILLIKKSDHEYINRYNNVNKIMTVPLQLKINNSYNELNALKKKNKVMLIYNDDKEFFRKWIEIWDKIIELIDTNYRYGHNKVVIVLNSIINDCIETSLVQHRY